MNGQENGSNGSGTERSRERNRRQIYTSSRSLRSDTVHTTTAIASNGAAANTSDVSTASGLTASSQTTMDTTGFIRGRGRTKGVIFRPEPVDEDGNILSHHGNEEEEEAEKENGTDMRATAVVKKGYKRRPTCKCFPWVPSQNKRPTQSNILHWTRALAQELLRLKNELQHEVDAFTETIIREAYMFYVNTYTQYKLFDYIIGQESDLEEFTDRMQGGMLRLYGGMPECYQSLFIYEELCSAFALVDIPSQYIRAVNRYKQMYSDESTSAPTSASIHATLPSTHQSTSKWKTKNSKHKGNGKGK